MRLITVDLRRCSGILAPEIRLNAHQTSIVAGTGDDAPIFLNVVRDPARDKHALQEAVVDRAPPVSTIAQELERQRLLDRERRIRRVLRSLQAIAAGRRDRLPRALALSIADLERQLREVTERLSVRA
ncbi:hypothetical protein Q5424_11480 [Conexibacter sp. JD483]|uniref:hypothetical protein n=1 Tax=unclassified Conexibacter TaxID=2627773 RepID=UPI0027180F2D|nr:MULTISPECIES: hypothetical protein [unclassified Conexibacter]MDO8187970.1 hypothetical protein [Conexibacter sp. CPCC 205706]MDO8200161.1 hypothetical protein [Conexibacter sp. CPCC 205762]MDR9369707.1 hypothetical protein [Conexibacter sp. JD483]